MVTDEESKKSPRNALQKEADKSPENGDGGAESMLSPGFRSVAAMAGWDEEALLIATLVVEDTPDRHFKQKKRSDFPLKTPPSNSRRKRRAQRKSPVSIPVTVLNLDDDDETAKEENEKPRAESKSNVNEEKKKTGDDDERKAEGSVLTCSTASSLPCMDRLREELSCAICLEICFEPSTTPCGHSFCKKCLRSAADKCGKRCPKCRQLMSNGRSCTVNTVLWNTIQLLFPQEVESRKEAASNPPRTEHSIEHGTLPERRRSYQSGTSTRSRNISGLGGVASGGESSGLSSRRRRRREAAGPSQDEDAALAMRLQREEFMDAFRGGDETILSARANLRAMASRAINIRIRGHGI